jgi:hypothetical protein
MAKTITWSRVMRTTAQAAAGIVNAGGYLAAVCGGTYHGTLSEVGRVGPSEVWASYDHGRTWVLTSNFLCEGDQGFAANWPFQQTGLLVPRRNEFIHPEDGNGLSFGRPGILKAHESPNQGVIVGANLGWSLWATPCMNGRKDTDGDRLIIWPGEFYLDAAPGDPIGPLLLELTQAGATTYTTAFLLHQLEPGNPAYVQAENGEYVWIWATTPPRLGSGTIDALYGSGDTFFFYASTDRGKTWRPYSDTQPTITPPYGDQDLTQVVNGATSVYFLRDGETVLASFYVSAIGPIIYRSTQRGFPGTWKPIYMPGAYPLGSGGLIQMTHRFCEMDDGTLICVGGAPEGSGPPMDPSFVGSGGPEWLAARAALGPIYHYPQVWRSVDKGLSWTNVSRQVGDFGTLLPLDSQVVTEGRLLVNLGDNCAFLAIFIESLGVAKTILGNEWTPFYISQDGGQTFEKSPVPYIGIMTDADDLDFGSVVPQQVTFTNEGNLLVVLHDNLSAVEIWLGEINVTPSAHRAVGFLEQADSASSGFPAGAIPENELGRG